MEENKIIYLSQKLEEQIHGALYMSLIILKKDLEIHIMNKCSMNKPISKTLYLEPYIKSYEALVNFVRITEPDLTEEEIYNQYGKDHKRIMNIVNDLECKSEFINSKDFEFKPNLN